MDDKPLPITLCTLCGAAKNPIQSWNPVYAEWTWWYDHVSPTDCIKHLRKLIDDIGSRRIV
jgi:hypothetical protein